MKNKKIYGFVLLALIIMLLPLGMVSAKYKQTKDVGTVILDIVPPVLSPTWYTKISSDVAINKLIVDSFKPNAQPNTYSELGFKWEEGKPIGYNPDGSDNFKAQVRLFEKNDTAYILAQGKNPVIFPENSMYLFAGWNIYAGTDKIIFNNINTSKVKNMDWMFAFCNNLTSLDISSFNTSNVIDMSNMFYYCAKLTSLDLSGFDTSNVAEMDSMFAECDKLSSLNFGDKFLTSNVTSMANMFNSCSSLTNLDVSKFNTSKVTDMSQMFNKCSKLESLDLSGFDTSNVTEMDNMFNTCKSLTNILFGTNFKTKKVTNMSGMFGTCTSLSNLDLSSFETTAVIYMEDMFYDCETLTSLNLSNFETPELTNMKQMFMKCRNLQSLDLSSFSTLNITNMSNLFTDCSQLKQITLGAEFKFINYSADKTVLLPGQKNGDIPGANGLWYISNSGQGYNSTDVAVYHNEHNTTTTYYAVQSEAPSSTNTFSLLTENGTINGAIQGN